MTDPATSDAPARLDVGRVALLAALTAFPAMSIDMYLPAFPAVAATFATDTAAVRLTMAAFLIGMALGQVVWGPLSDRYGRKRPLLLGLAVYVVTSVLIAISPNIEVLTALRFVQAFGGAAGFVISRAIARDLYSGRDLARMLSAITVVFGLAPILAPLMGSAVLAVTSWRWIFGVLTLFGLACFAFSAPLPETLPEQQRSGHDVRRAVRQYGHILRERRFRYAAMVGALGSVTLFSYVSSASVVVIEAYGQSPATFAWVFAGLSICVSAGAQLNLRLLRRYAPATVLRAGVVGQVVTTALVLLVAVTRAPFWLLVIPLVATLTTFNAVNGNGMAIALDPFPRAAASAAALLGGIQMGLGSLATALQAGLPWWPPIGMSLVMAGSALAALLVVLAHRRLHRRLVGG